MPPKGKPRVDIDTDGDSDIDVSTELSVPAEPDYPDLRPQIQTVIDAIDNRQVRNLSQVRNALRGLL